MPPAKNSTEKKHARPILWIGGSGLPGGATGRRLSALGHPIHWERLSVKAVKSARTIQPILVVIESERATPATRQLLQAISDQKASTDLVVFQLRRAALKKLPPGLDGFLLKGPGLAQQIQVVLQTMEGGSVFKNAGARAQKRLQKMKIEVARLRNLAVKDDLTSIYNLRFFNKTLEAEHQRAQRFGRYYSLIFLDLDGLRAVNESNGHLVGARVLQQVGEFLSHHLRRMDLPARIGGDEFVIICPETTKLAARRVAERLRLGIQRLQDSVGKSLRITASIGVASFPEDGDLAESVLQRADRALYTAKAKGKNRVCYWGEFDNEEDQASARSASVHLEPLKKSADPVDDDGEEEGLVSTAGTEPHHVN